MYTCGENESGARHAWRAGARTGWHRQVSSVGMVGEAIEGVCKSTFVLYVHTEWLWEIKTVLQHNVNPRNWSKVVTTYKFIVSKNSMQKKFKNWRMETQVALGVSYQQTVDMFYKLYWHWALTCYNLFYVVNLCGWCKLFFKCINIMLCHPICSNTVAVKV
jgi:hypothetical protein